MTTAAFCTRCREFHPVIGGRFACPQPAKPTGDRPTCGFALVNEKLDVVNFPGKPASR
jgi:hypothetical protein